MRLKSALGTLVMLAIATQALTTGTFAASGVSSRAKPLGAERAVDIAMDHVRKNLTEFDVSAPDVAELLVTDAYRSEHNGVTHVYLRQMLDGLEVLGANMTVNITRAGRVLYVGSRFVRGLHGDASGRVELDAVEAVRAAAAHLGLPSPTSLRFIRKPAGTSRSAILSGGGISTEPIPVKLAYQPAGRGLRLAWNLEIAELSELHWWNMSIDAATGSVLAKVDLVDHDNHDATAAAVGRRSLSADAGLPGPVKPRERARDGSSYRVYALPLESPNDGDRTLVKNPAERVASPFGWHDTDGKDGNEFTTTNGNNTHAYVEYTGAGNQPLPAMDADGGESLTFDFAIDFSLPPQTFKDAAVTNLFLMNNTIHDILYLYGFDERSGNFQVNTYDRGGVGGDPVMAEGQDGGGVNNANFATPADGTPGRMQMYLWPNTGHRQLIDGDLDNGVIIHEYTHGVSNRLTGGGETVDCLREYEEREGEGWSDWIPIALTARKGDKGADPRGMGTYVLGQSDRKQKGIRPTPYSTDMAINPATYETIKTSAVPHGVGYVWATMLWEVYWNLVDKHGFNPNPYDSWKTGGNNLAIQLVMDGMKFQPCKPGFVDARDAILAADRALTGGDNKCEIWAGFAKRGLGYKADQGDQVSRADGKEDFHTHPACS